MGVTVPEEYGGAGLDALAAVIILEELSFSDPGLGLAYLAHALLCTNNLSVNGSQEQKRMWLPKLCSGEHVGCMAMSEPHVGTDVLGMKAQAVSSGGGYKINGQKMWITNGVLDESGTPADITWVYVKTGKGAKDISTFVVEGDAAGFRVGQKIKGKLGMRASNTAELVFEDCQVSGKNLIGSEGDSLLHMMRNLEIERLSLAAQGLGIARRCLEAMKKYATERQAFGRSIADFGQIQSYIAQSYADYMSARTYTYYVAYCLDLEKGGNRSDSDGVKLVSAPMAKRVADRAIQVLGGYGYVSEYVVERLWRDAKLLEIGGGTLEAHQKNITKDLLSIN